MRLAFHIGTLARGGAERVVTNLADEFSNEGHTVYVVTVSTRDCEYTLADNVHRYVLENRRSGNFVVRNIRRVISLRRVLKDIKPDVLISFMAEPNVRALVASQFLGIKTIVSVRNDPSKEYATKLSRLFAKVLFQTADGVVFQTQDAKKWFSAAIQQKSAVIPNQVNEVFFQTKRISKPRDIVAIGRLVPQKNHKNLINAFSLIADSTKEDLVIYGEGNPESNLRSELLTAVKERNLEDRVRFAGNVDNVQEVLAKAKLFVLSSDYEGMPNALLEAMAVGVPCVSTDCPCGGPRMIIEDGENGFLVPVDDVEAMAEAMMRVLASDELAAKLSAKAKASAERFRPNVVFDQWKKYVVENIGNRLE